jgi:MSHA biogenesis protein MshJ
MLEDMLSRNRKLQLVDMRTLPTTTLGTEGDKAPGDKPAGEKPAPKPGGQIYRHGVEVTVSGSYLDLLAYLRDLEKLPHQLYWGRMELAAAPAAKGGTTVTMKLSVHTLSLDLAWLVV